MANKKILYIDFGGLGDHLAFSTIPEICHKSGYELYLSNKTKFRDNQIFELVWKLNPFFKGMTDDEPNCGHNGYTNLENYDYSESIHRNYEVKIGLGSTKLEHGSKYPIIYYTPNNMSEYNDFILIDLNSVSLSDYNLDVIKNHISSHHGQKFLFITPTYSKPITSISLLNGLDVTEINTKDIFNYADLIFSCKKIICLWSGSSVLSASIKNQYKNNLEIDCFKNYEKHQTFGVSDKTHFWYENINYIPA
jgi:hypothetical protein